MNEELLQALEGAYAKGYDINWAKQFATNNGAGDLIPEIEDFYKKKKDLVPYLGLPLQKNYLQNLHHQRRLVPFFLILKRGSALVHRLVSLRALLFRKLKRSIQAG